MLSLECGVQNRQALQSYLKEYGLYLKSHGKQWGKMIRFLLLQAHSGCKVENRMKRTRVGNQRRRYSSVPSEKWGFPGLLFSH